MVERVQLNEHYEPRLEDARERLAQSSAIQRIFSLDLSEKEALSFLLNFSSFGVAMTRSVDDWIRRAGERCVACGYERVGRALIDHAHHEAGHHTMMEADTAFLARWWEDKGFGSIDAAQLLSRPTPKAISDYASLHEDIIASDAPYAQLAVEYEIEALSVRYGGPLVQLCKRIFGDEIQGGLSFLDEHATLDVGHTAFNAGQIDRLIESHPKEVDELVSAGQRALATYGAFIAACFSEPVPAPS